MTTDALVTNDLAALATDNRRGIPAVDALLVRDVASHEELRLLGPARIYARRVATLVSSASAIAYAAVLLLVTWNPVRAELNDAPVLRVLTNGTTAKLLLVVLVARGIAAHFASRGFERKVQAGASATRLAQALDGWALAVGIAGTTVVAVIIGASELGIGHASWTGDGWGANAIEAIRALVWQAGLASAVALGAGVLLGRAATHERRWVRALETRFVAIGGGLAVFATLCVAMRTDAGDLDALYMTSSRADLGMRLVLTFTGMLGVLAMSASLSLRRRRREISILNRSIT